MLNLIRVVVDVLRSDIGVLQKVSFPKTMVACHATGVEFALCGEMHGGVCVIPSDQPLGEPNPQQALKPRFTPIIRTTQLRQRHRAIQQAARVTIGL